MFTSSTDLETIALSPPSDERILSERLYWHHRDTERVFNNGNSGFSLRTHGFFVPPKSCVYSFHILTDRRGSLWFSFNGTNLTKIAYAHSGTGQRSVS